MEIAATETLLASWRVIHATAASPCVPEGPPALHAKRTHATYLCCASGWRSRRQSSCMLEKVFGQLPYIVFHPNVAALVGSTSRFVFASRYTFSLNRCWSWTDLLHRSHNHLLRFRRTLALHYCVLQKDANNPTYPLRSVLSKVTHYV